MTGSFTFPKIIDMLARRRLQPAGMPTRHPLRSPGGGQLEYQGVEYRGAEYQPVRISGGRISGRRMAGHQKTPANRNFGRPECRESALATILHKGESTVRCGGFRHYYLKQWIT
ncbi:MULTISPECIES: hypothetical protein [Bartonella]|uniref:hypothetical protein n=1 Tax=Bartonella TaxID=773 RepID=UPI0018DB0523|nr:MULTISPECIES: hypothetical protein [Bartonella]MBH9976101.1 hypothetical protein [Bartonella choladocola]MBI0015557.1 hypothetical protein [Bartonella sp. B10834G3]